MRRAFVDVATKSRYFSLEPLHFGSQSANERFEFLAAHVVVRHHLRLTQRRTVSVRVVTSVKRHRSGPEERIGKNV